MKVCFVVGMEDTREAPGDTPEAFWRVGLPAQHLKASIAILGHVGAMQKALAADVIWIHQPTCFAAASLADVARNSGKTVIADFCEDPWERAPIDNSYVVAPGRLEAAKKALACVHRIVVATPGLVPRFTPYGLVDVIETMIPKDWTVGKPATPPIIGWWSDGRQRKGLEDVSAPLRKVLAATSARMAHIQFAHHAPIMKGLVEKEAVAERASRLSAFFENDRDLSAAENMKIFRDALAECYLSLECYPAGAYRETVSDLPLLRAAALGVPSVTTRSVAPPGSIAAGPDQFEAVILGLLAEPRRRRDLAQEARTWAQTRTHFEAYQATIEEVR